MRPLSPQLVDVPFSGGLDAKSNEKLVLPGKFIVLENAQFTEAGTLKKRNGYSALSRNVLNGTAIAAGKALGRFNDEMLLFNDSLAYSYSASLDQWISKGSVPASAIAAKPIIRNTYQQSNPDAATVNGLTLYAWADTRGGVRASLVDEETGASVLADTSIHATAVRPRCVAIGRYLFVLYQSGANVLAKRIDTLSPTAFSSEFTLAINGNTTAGQQHLDACPVDSDAALFVYNVAEATNALVLGYLLADGTVGQPTNGYPSILTIAEAADQSITVAQGTTDAPASKHIIIVAWSNATAARFAYVKGQDFSYYTSPTNIEAIGTVENITALFNDVVDRYEVFYEVSAAATYNRLVKGARIDGAGALVSGPTILVRSVGLGSKAWLHSSRPYVVLVHDSTLQATYFAISADFSAATATSTLIAKILASSAGGLQSGQVPSVFSPSSGVFAFAASQKTKFVSEENTTFSLVGVTRSSLTFEPTGAYRSGQFGQNLLTVGGIVGAYDGQGFVESGFHLFPHDITEVENAAGGSMATGAYLARFCWEWEDAKGQTHRSAPSAPVASSVTGPTGRITWTVPTLRITEKRSPRTNVRLACYSTEASGLVYYKTPHQAGSVTANPVYNDPAADTITFERTVADASILSNEILYTQGGVIENIGPPAASLLAIGKKRAFLSGLEDPYAFWWSKEDLLGEGVQFSDLFSGRLDPAGGVITALGMLDDKAVFFKRDAIHVLAGDGPDATGANNTFTEAILVTTDVGCTNPASVAITPEGLIFESAKGLARLTRGLQVEYIGAPVERKVSEVTIRSALLNEDANQVRVLTSGEALVYDYFFKEWATWKNHIGVDQAIFDGEYHYLRSDGTVYRETPDSFTDAGLTIPMRLKTAWIKLASLQGFMRVWRALFIGDFYTSHDIRVRTAFDYQPFWLEEETWDPDANLLGTDYGGADYGEGVYGGESSADLVYQFEVNFRNQLCESIQFEIEDVGSGNGKAYSLSMLTLEVGIEQGPFRLPDGKRVGS